jgi:hypothetical protein
MNMNSYAVFYQNGKQWCFWLAEKKLWLSKVGSSANFF